MRHPGSASSEVPEDDEAVPPGTEIDIFKQDPNDWRCQNMWNGCKKLTIVHLIHSV